MEKQTLLGKVYGGKNSGKTATGLDYSTAYLGLDRGSGNDYSLRANRFGTDPNSGFTSPTYAVGLNLPQDTKIPNYWGEVNTPLGLLGVGTNDGNPNINASYVPSDTVVSLYNALMQNYMNRR